MANFTLSAFADEINPALDIQMRVIKDCGIHHIEVRGIDGKNISTYTPDEAKQIKRQLDQNGVKISSVGSPIGKIKITSPMDDHLAVFRNVIEIAKILDTQYIRLFSFYIPEGEDPANYRDEVLKRMQMFVDTAKGSGLTLLHENEKGIYGDTDKRCLDILESIGSETLKAVFDPANFVQCGVSTYPEAFELLLPYIEYMHIKDAGEDGVVVPAGHGIGKVPEILGALKEKGFDGFLSLEPHLAHFVGLSKLEAGREREKVSQDTEEKFRMAVDALKQILNRL